MNAVAKRKKSDAKCRKAGILHVSISVMQDFFNPSIQEDLQNFAHKFHKQNGYLEKLQSNVSWHFAPFLPRL